MSFFLGSITQPLHLGSFISKPIHYYHIHFLFSPLITQIKGTPTKQYSLTMENLSSNVARGERERSSKGREREGPRGRKEPRVPRPMLLGVPRFAAVSVLVSPTVVVKFSISLREWKINNSGWFSLFSAARSGKYFNVTCQESKTSYLKPKVTGSDR